MTTHPNMKSFLLFCESKNPEEEYNYFNQRICAMAQFLGPENYQTSQFTPINRLGTCEALASQKPHTFGALATRLRKELAR